MKSPGHQRWEGEEGGTVSPSSTYQAPEAPEEGRAGIYLSFHGHVCWAWANLVISFIQGGYSPMGRQPCVKVYKE